MGCPPHPAHHRAAWQPPGGDLRDRSEHSVTKGDLARQVATRTAIEVGTAGLGYAVGGPVCALVAAAIKPTLDLVAVREERGLRNIERVVELVAEATGLSPEDFAAWANRADGRLMLATNAIQAAYNTLYEEKIAALATVLAENLRDDARLDISVLIVAALADLEAMHVRVLNSIEGQDLPRRPDDRDHILGVVIQSQLEEHFPNLASGVLPIMAALERHGLVVEGLAHAEDDHAWRVTAFGRYCLSYLREASNP